jgi:hypothetical protein
MRSVANAHRKKVFTTDRWTAGNAGLQLERPRAAPVGQQPGVDTLKQDDLSGVGIVRQSGEHPSRLRGVFDTSLSHVAQVQVGRRLDGDVVCLFDRFLAATLQFESILQLACRLGGDVPRAGLRRLLELFFLFVPLEPEGAFAPLPLSGVLLFALRALRGVPRVDRNRHTFSSTPFNIGKTRGTLVQRVWKDKSSTKVLDFT